MAAISKLKCFSIESRRSYIDWNLYFTHQLLSTNLLKNKVVSKSKFLKHFHNSLCCTSGTRNNLVPLKFKFKGILLEVILCL